MNKMALTKLLKLVEAWDAFLCSCSNIAHTPCAAHPVLVNAFFN